MRRFTPRVVTAAWALAGVRASRSYSTAGKVKVNITTQDGTACDFEAPVGVSLMEAIRDIAGLEMEGACGGCASCSTCHVYVSEGWAKKLLPASDKEEDTLDKAFDAKENSRLACQITLKPEVDGIEVALPASVNNLLMM